MTSQYINWLRIKCSEHKGKRSVSGNEIQGFSADLITCEDCKTIFRDKYNVVPKRGPIKELQMTPPKYALIRPGFFSRIWYWLTHW